MNDLRSRPESTRIALLVIGLLALTAIASLPAAPAHACEDGLPQIGYLGISDLACDCSTNFGVRSVDGQRTVNRSWLFRSEPVIRGLQSDGPAAGKLREGDVITAVNGALITTREGSRRFSWLQPGQNLTLTVRRDGREIPVAITVGGICPEEVTGPLGLRMLLAPVPPAAETPPETPVAPGDPDRREPPQMAPLPRVRAFEYMGPAPRMSLLPKVAADALPHGWLGIGLTCQQCGGNVADADSVPVWSFATLPTISYVEPEGPAARAGLRRGDQLTHIDGVSLLTPDGGRRFGAVQAGQTVQWTMIRDGERKTVRVTAERRPGERREAMDAFRDYLRAMRDQRGATENMDRQMQELARRLGQVDAMKSRTPGGDRVRRLRYAGTVAGSDVEVRGLGNVVVDDSGDEIVITTSDATIHIRPSASGSTPAAKPKRRDDRR